MNNKQKTSQSENIDVVFIKRCTVAPSTHNPIKKGYVIGANNLV